MNLADLIAEARAEKCSDLHITAGTAVAVRRYGQLYIKEDIKPTIDESESMIYSLLSPQEIEIVNRGEDLDIALTDETSGRLRINVYHQRNNLACSIRLLEKNIPTFADLGIDENVLTNFANRRSGMILVTGSTGSGKSTTLASIIEYINTTQARHVITVEDPIEFVFDHKKAMIHQRQVGRDVPDFATALRSSLREDPDVIMVGEMRDFETVNAAITAAETGHLVLSTLHTISAAQTVERIISACPAEVKDTILQQFASVLAGAITQELIPLKDGSGRVACTEIMINNTAIGNLIREQKTKQINAALQSGMNVGMHTMSHSLTQAIRTGKISKEAAIAHAPNPIEFEKILNNR
ncbi:MAG: PilT/PilU family type 4a pilus ATPase [Lachnospiraceae bacterium]|nr:PilT/PilU family type 4a pilus ATPase [Candidatus Merdinaster equi]